MPVSLTLKHFYKLYWTIFYREKGVIIEKILILKKKF